jgi:hypothetical protein
VSLLTGCHIDQRIVRRLFASFPRLDTVLAHAERSSVRMPLQHWPGRLWVVRHGESSGNVARDVAHAARLTRIDTGAARDVDVPLS